MFKLGEGAADIGRSEAQSRDGADAAKDVKLSLVVVKFIKIDE